MFSCAGVIAAAALKCMGGNIQGRLWPRTEEEKQCAMTAGFDLAKVIAGQDIHVVVIFCQISAPAR